MANYFEAASILHVPKRAILSWVVWSSSLKVKVTVAFHTKACLSDYCTVLGISFRKQKYYKSWLVSY